MKSYRLVDFRSLDDLQLYEENTPQPQRGEVLIRVRAVSLNYRDIAMLGNTYPLSHRKGLVPTSDGAGEVVEVGPDVEDFKTGDRVAGIFHARWFGGRMPIYSNQRGYGSENDGWLCEFKVVSQEAIVRIPDNLSFEEAATLPCAAVTAWNALCGTSQIRAGHRVLIQGTGGVSIFALQFAKVLGASVIATTSSVAKAERLRQFGASEVINYKEEPQWGKRVRELTHGKGVDLIVEVGGPGTIAESLRAIAPGGEIASIGFLSAQGEGIDFFALFGSLATFRPFSVGSRETLEDVCAVMTMSNIKPVIDRIFEFNDAKAAYAHLGSGSHFGKIIIRC
ncbi:zinc-dependent alcohol dehydrogenase family protein [Acerihabitans arboris]|uniref:Zinc-binding dehydrogenase n=1 Tax=Acerihabitans arboris TaxID=2691583 RepID=A0A845SGF8_9GAMM|nr:NAD(P)-dependent alcohol dehydrogenase [Acerihabitans arboris]NDL62034.1 zinc-binding dehydrogenase [Acerihabitans arboris]